METAFSNFIVKLVYAVRYFGKNFESFVEFEIQKNEF